MAGKREILPLLFILPFILLLFFWLWGLRLNHPQMVSVYNEDGVWDLTEVDFSRDFVRLRGGGEYVLQAMLSTEEFRRWDEQGRVQIGDIGDGFDYATIRLRVRLPAGDYLMAGQSIDYSQALYLDGALALEMGRPGTSREDTVPDNGYFTVPVHSDGGVVEIIQQYANYVHKDVSGHTTRYIGSARLIGSYVARRAWAEAVPMGCYLVLFLLHLGLYLLRRSYRVNLLFSLFCLVWFFRGGVTGMRLLRIAVPAIGWEAGFRIEYLSIPLTCIVLLWLMDGLFPGRLPRAFLWVSGALAGLYALVCLFLDTLPLSHTLNVFHVLMGVMAVVILVRILTGKRPFLAEQWVLLAGFLLFVISFAWDALHHNGIRFFSLLRMPITETMVLIFTLFAMMAIFMGTLRLVREAGQAEEAARLQAEEALQREEVYSRIPPEHTLIRGPLILDTLAAQAFLNGEDLLLSPKEFALMHLLVQNERQHFTGAELYALVWKQEPAGSTRAVTTCVSRLRSKLAASDKVFIEAERGRGYRFEWRA